MTPVGYEFPRSLYFTFITALKANAGALSPLSWFAR